MIYNTWVKDFRKWAKNIKISYFWCKWLELAPGDPNPNLSDFFFLKHFQKITDSNDIYHLGQRFQEMGQKPKNMPKLAVFADLGKN